MRTAKLRNTLTGEVIAVHATTDSPDSSYGIPCWVDNEGNSYGQVPYGPPLGFEIDIDEDEAPAEDDAPADDVPTPYSLAYNHKSLAGYVPSAKTPHLDALAEGGLLDVLTPAQVAQVVVIAQTAYRNGQASMGAERVDTNAIWVNGVGMIELTGGQWELTAPDKPQRSQAAAAMGSITSAAKTRANRAKANLPPKAGKKPRGRPRKQKP